MSETKSYGQYCPITRAMEVLGERWSMLIVRDLLCGATRFNQLSRGNPRLSRTLLANAYVSWNRPASSTMSATSTC